MPAVVREAIEVALSGGLPAAGAPAAGAQLLERVEALEQLHGDLELGSVRLSRCMNGQAELIQRLQALEAAVAWLQRPASPERVRVPLDRVPPRC